MADRDARRKFRPSETRFPGPSPRRPLPNQDRLGNAGSQRMLEMRSRLFGQILRRELPISRGAHPLEHAADRLPDLSTETRTSLHSGTAGTKNPSLISESGSPLNRSLQAECRSQFGNRLEGVRIHKGKESAEAAALLGAEAFTHGRDIFLGERASETDRGLMRHELGHAFQNLDAVQLREATWLERRAWLAFFDHYLPRKFLNNYMDDTGHSITLTQQEMQDCNPIVNLRRSPAFMAEIARLQAAGGGASTLSITGWGGALTNGTLGNFTIHYDGMLTVAADGTWTFSGTMWFEDYWDFNPGGPNRPLGAEIKVRVADTFLPGRPFPIDSVRVPVSQTNVEFQASWSAAAPRHVPDRLGRTGTDIEVGAGVGASGGPDLEAGGAEVGAQSAEDLNP